MSWSASFNIKDGEIQKDTLFQSGADIYDPTDAVSSALWASFNIIGSGAVGTEDKEYRVVLNGHENPDHEPSPGWANDSITVSVTQV